MKVARLVVVLHPLAMWLLGGHDSVSRVAVVDGKHGGRQCKSWIVGNSWALGCWCWLQTTAEKYWLRPKLWVPLALSQCSSTFRWTPVRELSPFVKPTLEEHWLTPVAPALVFSAFRHTLAYLSQHVEQAGQRYGLVHGGVPDEERSEIRRRFALPENDPESLDILLSSEVGCEGLDFQFCDFLVNYDLPWNPMRIEQRIGRIDRYGQESLSFCIRNIRAHARSAVRHLSKGMGQITLRQYSLCPG